MHDLSTNPLSDEMRPQFLAYLSSKLSEDERAQFEERLLAEQDFSDRATEVEFELLEDFAAGRLNAEESALIREWIAASPARATRAQTTALLQKKLKPRTSVWIPAGLTLLAASLALFAMFLVGRHKAKSAQPITMASTPHLHVATPDTILLVATRLRGPVATARVYPIHRDAPLRLQLILPPHTPDTTFNLDLATAENAQPQLTLQRDHLQPATTGGIRYVELLLPPNTLPPSRYVATLHGSSGDFDTSFSIAWQ